MSVSCRLRSDGIDALPPCFACASLSGSRRLRSEGLDATASRHHHVSTLRHFVSASSCCYEFSTLRRLGATAPVSTLRRLTSTELVSTPPRLDATAPRSHSGLGQTKTPDALRLPRENARPQGALTTRRRSCIGRDVMTSGCRNPSVWLLNVPRPEIMRRRHRNAVTSSAGTSWRRSNKTP